VLASHTELPKTVGTIPTYIVYDTVTQCFGHEPLSEAMRFSQEPNNWLYSLQCRLFPGFEAAVNPLERRASSIYRRLRATAARTGASAATWQAPLARFARALRTAIKKGRGAHTFSCGRRCPAGADEGMRCAPWPANCPHPAVPARPRKRGSPRSLREKERRPRRVCNSTLKRARAQPSGSAAPVPRVTRRSRCTTTSPCCWNGLAMTSSVWPGQPTPSDVCCTTS